MVLLRILKWFTIIALRLGVGLNSEQFTTRMSICAGTSRRLPVGCAVSKLLPGQRQRPAAEASGRDWAGSAALL